MDCTRVRERIPSYLNGVLATSVVHQVEAHLADCPDCSRHVEKARMVNSVRAATPIAHPSPDFATRLLSQDPPGRPRRTRTGLIVLSVVAVVLLAAACAAAFLFYSPPPP